MPSENLPYLFAVYSVTWVLFFAYVFYVSRRQRDLEREIKDLRAAMKSVDEDSSSSSG
ncbi:MAG: CcmD family protein [Dehalococcoidia bacterium]|nr:CcmD family protein [Dehalococcoidia bacterium]